MKQEIWRKQAAIISKVLESAETFDTEYLLPREEFLLRQKKVWDMLEREGAECGIVYSDEHYCGDVPYLAGNNNIIVEPIAAVLGKNGLFFIAGLESGIVAEQFCHRSDVKIRKTDILKIGSENYPEGVLTPEQIIEEACGRKPETIALLTSKGIFPTGLYMALEQYAGRKSIQDLSEQYYKIKYEKSDREMRLIEESCRISDVMLEGMIRVLEPGLRECQLAQWGYAIAAELGADAMGFDVMVTTGKNNRTIVGRASNAVIKEGDTVHIGVAPKRDGLCGAQRASVFCVRTPQEIPDQQRIWMQFLEEAFHYAVQVFQEIAEKDLPGNVHEKKMLLFYEEKAKELQKLTGIPLHNFSRQKGYVTSHNSGYTECQEFYGALDTKFDEKCARQMVLMLDVGLKGFGDRWDDIVIPGLDYLVIEKTTGKYGNKVRVLNQLPVNLQYLVGEAF